MFCVERGVYICKLVLCVQIIVGKINFEEFDGMNLM